MKILNRIFWGACCMMCVAGCSGNAGATEQSQRPAQTTPVPTFSADSAFAYVARQVEFGPRVPGTAPSAHCALWLADELRRHGADTVITRQGTVTAYTGQRLPINNIFAQFNSSAAKRLMLVAHWDSRPWADMEPNPQDRNRPIDGANDGASGVAVILEIARQISAQTPRVGVDVLLVDAEDYGHRADEPAIANSEDSWALGTQYWIEHPTIDPRNVRYAVLLDMVGGRDAVFHREIFSQQNAPQVVDRVWAAAHAAGHADRFLNSYGGAITDDHVYLQQAGIPAIDIIEMANPATGSFNPTWHTHADNLENIDPATLQAVGQTMLQLIYNE